MASDTRNPGAGSTGASANGVPGGTTDVEVTRCQTGKQPATFGPHITRLRRLRGCDKPWRVTLAGHDRELDCNTRSLFSYTAFRRRALTVLAVCLPEMSESEWLSIVGAALQRVSVDGASPDDDNV